MSGYRIVFIQSGGGGTHAVPSPDVQVRVTPPELGEQIRAEIGRSIQAATASADVSRDMRQAIRDAQQRVRDAEQQLRNARTDDQRGAARQELMGATAELRALQSVGPVMVHAGTAQPQDNRDLIPPQIVDMSIAFFIMVAVILIGWPLARAFARRIERRPDTPVADPALAGQLLRIEQAVEAMAIEIERISESQRFLTKLQSGAGGERTPLGAGERR